MTARDECDFSPEQDNGFAERKRLRQRVERFQASEDGDAFSDIDDEEEDE